MSKRKEPLTDDRRLEAWLAAALLPASPAFCERVMRAIEARPLSWHARLRRFLFSPRRLQWNVAGATAMSAGVIGLTVVLALWDGREAPDGRAAGATVTVRFELRVPQAQRVMLAGDFTHWQARIPLHKKPDGTWAAEIPLHPGNYEYMFIVDGDRWISDPRASQYRADGFGNNNAVLTVPSV